MPESTYERDSCHQANCDHPTAALESSSGQTFLISKNLLEGCYLNKFLIDSLLPCLNGSREIIQL